MEDTLSINRRFQKGIFIISLDTEFAWGTSRARVPFKKKQFEQTRAVITELLKLFGRYQIRATWAVVGKLLEREGFQENSIWYARDAILQIIKCSPAQEIGCHSYMHKNFARLTPQEASADLDACIEAGEKLGIRFESFVCPYNSVAHTDVLVQKNFSCYRGVDERWYKKWRFVPPYVKIALNALEEMFAIAPPCVMPHRTKQGIVEIPGSTPYLPRDSFLRFIPVGAKVRRARKGIDRAIAEGKIFHLWFHPFNIASDAPALLAGLEEILAYAARKRGEGMLDILSMGEVAETFRNRLKSPFRGNIRV